jgi:hypothetical protein
MGRDNKQPGEAVNPALLARIVSPQEHEEISLEIVLLRRVHSQTTTSDDVAFEKRRELPWNTCQT